MALSKEEFQWGPESVGAVRLDDLVWDWKRALRRQERAPSTVATYDWALTNFRRFLGRHGAYKSSQLRRDLVERWQDECRERLGRRSRSTASVAVRQFLRWAVGQGSMNPRAPYWVTHVPGVRGKPRPIPGEDLGRILSYLGTRRFAGSLVALRDRALFLYILSTGTRVSEALQVKRTEVARAIVQQKGGWEKDYEVAPIVIEALEEYLAERQDMNPWMWVTLVSNYPMRPLTGSGVREVWRRIAAAIGVTPWTTHQLRHTGATELYEADIDGVVVADWLGHRGMGHVTQYTRVSRRRRRQAVDVLQRLIERHSEMPHVTLLRKSVPPSYERE